jgi:threonine synthase
MQLALTPRGRLAPADRNSICITRVQAKLSPRSSGDADTVEHVLVASNGAAQLAADTFLELEGVDIEPAAGVAVACLLDAVAQERIEREAVILLNITGGGRRRLAIDYPLVPAEPKLRLSRKFIAGDTVRQIAALCAIS